MTVSLVNRAVWLCARRVLGADSNPEQWKGELQQFLLKYSGHRKLLYVTGSEKMTLIAHLHQIFFAIERKAHIRFIVCSLFQACSLFRCEVMIANAGAVPLRLSEKSSLKLNFPCEIATSVFSLQVFVTTLQHHPQCIYRIAPYFRGA